MKPLSQREERNDETVNVQTTRFYMSLVSSGDPEKRLFKYYVVEPTNTSAGSQTISLSYPTMEDTRVHWQAAGFNSSLLSVCVLIQLLQQTPSNRNGIQS